MISFCFFSSILQSLYIFIYSLWLLLHYQVLDCNPQIKNLILNDIARAVFVWWRVKVFNLSVTCISSCFSWIQYLIIVLKTSKNWCSMNTSIFDLMILSYSTTDNRLLNDVQFCFWVIFVLQFLIKKTIFASI